MEPMVHAGQIKTMREVAMVRQSLAASARRFASDENAATAIEYALIAAGVGVAISSAVWTLGSEVKQNLYDKISAIF